MLRRLFNFISDSEVTYPFDEHSPVIAHKNGGFSFNYKNPKACEKLLENFRKCKNLSDEIDEHIKKYGSYSLYYK